MHSEGFILHYTHSYMNFLDLKFSQWWKDVELAVKTKHIVGSTSISHNANYAPKWW